MDNYEIAEQLSLLSKLMDIHGENAFKAKSYASAAFSLEKLPQQVAGLPAEKINAIRGIGASVGSKVVELIQTGELTALQELIRQTPEGVLAMMHIKGLGPKKIHTIWKELNISSVGELKEACLENKLAATKGFGEKTEQKILEAIQFSEQNEGSYMYAEVEAFAEALSAKLSQHFPEAQFAITGSFRRQWDVVDCLEWVTTADAAGLKAFFSRNETSLLSESSNMAEFIANGTLRLRFHFSSAANFAADLFRTTGSTEFVAAWESAYEVKASPDEAAIFEAAGIPTIPPYLRERSGIIGAAKAGILPDDVVTVGDIRGLIHSHSTWSDGAYSIEQMATELIARGFEYLVISDHSKAAYYANGLDEERIRQQHREIDALNQKLAPFKIYKSIECDILGDGSMDYGNDVLASFDLVIASIHSNLDMPEEKAMMRLMGAIRNPYVTIIGHLTGRLLTRRKGYPVDHKAIIDACAEKKIAIEINSSPHRLDMDWRWIDHALEKGVMLSINPDAHSFDDFNNLKYGVAVAQKGGLSKAENLSSFGRDAFENYITERKARIK
jgi:DNA polymerase (family 10)